MNELDYFRQVKRLREELIDIRRQIVVPDAEKVAWADLISLAMARPGLRGLWCASVYDGTNNPILKELVGRTNRDLQAALLANRVSTQVLGMTPTILFASAQSGNIRCASLAELNITGDNETDGNPSSGVRGITFGGWFQPRTEGTLLDQTYIGKYNTTGNQRSYQIRKNSSNAVGAFFSGDGTAFNQTPDLPVVNDVWHHIEGRWIPGDSVAIFVNGVKAFTDRVADFIFASTADFVVGARNNGTANYADMYAAIWYVYAQSHSDDMIRAYYHHTRALFGV